MATKTIAVRTNTYQYGTLQYVTLDGIRIGLQFNYSKLEGVWYMWLRAPSGTILAGPIKLVAGLDLLSPYKYMDDVPNGSMQVTATPDADTIDVSALLQYTEEE